MSRVMILVGLRWFCMGWVWIGLSVVSCWLDSCCKKSCACFPCRKLASFPSSKHPLRFVVLMPYLPRY